MKSVHLDVGTTLSNMSVLTASTALRYHYDAIGRVVGRTLDPGGVGEESQFFIYDGDRIIQELDESGNLVAAWDYGVYIDEILVMYRDVVPPAGLEPYYYLQDDHYPPQRIIAPADASGTSSEGRQGVSALPIIAANSAARVALSDSRPAASSPQTHWLSGMMSRFGPASQRSIQPDLQTRM